MRLQEIAERIDPLEVSGEPDVEIGGISFDSRRVRPGDLFFALPGSRSTGEAYIDDAVARGVVAVVTQGRLEPGTIPILRVADARRAMGRAAHHFYGYPARSMACTGITGTNGKTTTSYLLDAVLRRHLGMTAVVGTLGMAWEGSIRDLGLTTPESPTLAAGMADLRAGGCAALTMEVSSHGLALGRLAGMEFDVAVFTNLTRDHLDFHGTMERYLEAKLALFRALGTGEKTGRGVVNVDDPSGGRFLEEAPSGSLRVSARGGAADVRAAEVLADAVGSRVRVEGMTGPLELELRLPGRFNVSNALCALAAGLLLDIPVETIVAGIGSVDRVPGRMELLEGRGIRVIVDYAHTPDALENLLAAVEEKWAGRRITVFGCGGERDREKRPLMGAVAAERSDRVFLTTDNPRGEDPEQILDQIEAGVRRIRDDFTRVADRGEAIRRAIGEAEPGDTVIVAGKGHEDYQIVGEARTHFDDREVVRAALSSGEGGAV